MQKRWNILTADQNKLNSLHQSLNVNPILCKILVQRGIETFEEAKNFFVHH
jgi:single-stranded-DNA-specific exonuclease